MSTTSQANAPKVIQCPYCVEGDNFMVMKARADGHWFLCAHCAHVVIPDLPSYQCNCRKCSELGKPLYSDSR